MSFVFKSIEPSHITINPFYANKLWTLLGVTGMNLLDPTNTYITEASMSVYYGENNSNNYNWNPNINPEPQTSYGVFTRSVWDSVNNLFYGSGSDRNFYTAPLDFSAQGVDSFETRSLGSSIQVWSFPQKIIGKGIERGSFRVNQGGVSYMDDGNGNIVTDPGGVYSGNILYTHGLVIWTVGFNTGTTCAFKGVTFRSTKLINSCEVICISEADEHNMSGNPSLLAIQSGASNPGIGAGEPGNYNNDGECYSFVTSSFFSPYITSVGLYNDEGELLVIAKMARPVKKAMNCDTIFVVRWDS